MNALIFEILSDMNKIIDLREKFGKPSELLCNNFNKIHISIHPNFSGIYLCYQETFKSLKTDLSVLGFNPKLTVWKTSNIKGYTIVNDCQWYLHASQNIPESIKLMIYSFPTEEEKVRLLKQIASFEFLSFLSSFHHNLNKTNPQKLLNLINSHIASEAILALNKKNSFKPHGTMSLDLLAKLLSYTRNQLNYRNKVINQKRQNVLDQLEQTSEVVQQLLNNVDFVLTPDRLWKA